MLLTQTIQAPHLRDGDMDDFYRQARKIAIDQQLSRSSTMDQQSPRSDFKHLLQSISHRPENTPMRRRSSAKSSSSANSGSPPLRLAELAKQQVMATHVDNWREDMIPVRQHLPMQHIIGSLKRDRDELAEPAGRRKSSVSSPSEAAEETETQTPSEISSVPALLYYNHQSNTPTSHSSEDSFLDLLTTPKPDATSPRPDVDHRFTYQSPGHVAKDIPQSALPGLNMALNLATITAEERDLFSEYAPRDLDDPHVLMGQVSRMRELMMSKETNEGGEDQEEERQTDLLVTNDNSNNNNTDVAKDFDEFVNY